MAFKVERVNVAEIMVGDNVIHWDDVVQIQEILVKDYGYVFNIPNMVGGLCYFTRLPHETIVRIVSA